MAESDQDTPTVKAGRRRTRPRGLVACRRCQQRKQRCDNEFPTCSNCEASGTKCSFGSKQIYPAEYVRSLEQQVSKLQEVVASPARTVQHASSNTTGIPTTAYARMHVEDLHDSTLTRHASIIENGHSDLEASAGIVAPSPDSFLGTSSGYPLTKLLRSAMNQLGVADTNGAERNFNTASSNQSTPSISVDENPEKQSRHESNTPGSDMPTQQVGDMLIEAYYARVHPKHPFLPRKRIQRLHEARLELVPACRLQGPTSGRTKCDYATLQMVYAIGARYLQLTSIRNDDQAGPSRYYANAIADSDVIFATGSLESLEAMLLLTIYQLRSPVGLGVWWMIQNTMRYCIDHGLHRHAINLAPSIAERRKRIFWTTYMLERSIARTVGRPYSLADRDIDVRLPANIDDTLDKDEEIVAAIAESIADPLRITTLTPAIHIFRLHQIDSKISQTVCRVDRDISSIKHHKVARLRASLETWRAGIPSTPPVSPHESHPYITLDYHMIQYHKSIILLNLPFLPALTPKNSNFQEIVNSAGQICTLSKRLHDQQTYISFSLLSLHANFVAGLVMVYCFCLDPTVFGPRFSSSIRACSTMLYIISERWPRALQARKAFDRLVSLTIEGDGGARGLATQMHVMQNDPSGLNIVQEQMPFGGGAGEGNPEEIWNNFETILGDHSISTENWMHDSIFYGTMNSFQPMDWMG